MKYTKKPVTIDAIEFKGGFEPGLTEIRDWVRTMGDQMSDHFIVEMGPNTGLIPSKVKLKVKTLEGTSYDVPEGYFIIRGIKGEYYPCESKIFHDSYDKTL